MALTQSKSWSRLAQFALRTIIFFSIAFATLWTVLSFWPGLAILPFVGRAKISPFCSTWQAVRDAAVKVRQGELEKEIRANTRLIRTEKGYKLWSTPKGEFWVRTRATKSSRYCSRSRNGKSTATRKAEESGPGISCWTAARTLGPTSEPPWMPEPQK